MKKLSKINESMWGDIYRRNSGEVVRKEDDINILDGQGMLEYIFNHYVIQDNFSQPQYHKVPNFLNVPILKVKKDIYTNYVNNITYDYDKDCIYIRETLYNDVLIKIKKEFDISNFLNGVYTIKDADNSLFIKLIDFIIDNVDPMSKTVFTLLYKRKMNESMWGDIHRRNSGEAKRREDDINLLDLEGLCDYLNKIYKSPSSVSKSICVQRFNPDTELSVSLYEDIDGYYRFLFYSGTVVNTQRDVLYELKCNKEIQQKYSLKQLKNDFGVETVDIYPKDGSPVNNEFFLEVLEFFLENIKEPYTKLIEKIEDVKESMWGDIHRRNSGETVRKEDSIDLLDEEGLLVYLKKHYRVDNVSMDIRISDFHTKDTIQIPFCTAGYKNIKINALFFDYSSNKVFLLKDFSDYLPKLHNKLQKEFQMTYSKFFVSDISIISPKDNTKTTNTFFIKVLEFIIDNMDNTVTPTITRRQVNESVWSDIQDRSTGKTIRKEDEIITKENNHLNESMWGDIHRRNSGEVVRKEDDINLMDIDTFFEYLKEHYKVDDNYSVYGDMFLHIRPDKQKGIFIPYSGEIKKQRGQKVVSLSHIIIVNCEIIEISESIKDFPNLFKKLEEEFELHKNEDWRNTNLGIYPKDGGEVNNSFFLKVIDFIIDNADKKQLVLKRK